MKRSLLALLAALGALSTAKAEGLHNGFYTQLNGYGIFLSDKNFPLRTPLGTAHGDIDYDPGWGTGLGFGYRFDSGFRLQFEGSYNNINLNDYERSGRDLGLGSADLSIVNGLSGLYYDFNVGGRWRPYIGAGAGGAYTDFDNLAGRSQGTKDADVDFTAYGEGGIEIGLTEKVSIIPAYRYQWINNGEHGTEDDTAHEALLSLRYYFD